MSNRKQVRRIAWSHLEAGSINSVVRTLSRFPLFTNIGFRVRFGSPNRTALRVMAGAATGRHVCFGNLYPNGHFPD